MGIERTPHVDVVIPARNRARFIIPCLDSIRGQTLQPSRVVVVDDGSTDDTPGIVAEYARHWPLLHVVHSEPRGASYARNLGIAACRGPLVAFLDSDDIWLPQKLERQVALFAARPELGFVHCGSFQIDECGRVLADRGMLRPSKRGDVFVDLLEGFYPVCGSASAVVARRELVTTVGGFDEALFHGEDRDLWLRLANVSQLDYVPEALVGLRAHQDNSYMQGVPGQEEAFLFQRLRIWNKWLDRIKNIDAVLDSFRFEAFAVAVTQAISARPSFGLYARLQRSELGLARRLFPNLLSYLNYAVRDTFRCTKKIDARPRQIATRLKFIVATRLILRSKLLLRMLQKMGKFKMISD